MKLTGLKMVIGGHFQDDCSIRLFEGNHPSALYRWSSLLLFCSLILKFISGCSSKNNRPIQYLHRTHNVRVTHTHTQTEHTQCPPLSCSRLTLTLIVSTSCAALSCFLSGATPASSRRRPLTICDSYTVW